MHRVIAENQGAIAELCKRYGVMRLEVFGSAARANDFDESKSDADFMVQFGQDKQLGALEQFFGLRSELSALLSRPVDLVEQGALRNPFVIREINQARELVYAA